MAGEDVVDEKETFVAQVSLAPVPIERRLAVRTPRDGVRVRCPYPKALGTRSGDSGTSAVQLRPEEVVPGSEGITVGYLAGVVRPLVEELV